MNRKFLVLIGLLLVCQLGWAQTELTESSILQNLSKSLVTVTVKHAGGINQCTGFVWEKSNQVVTSLHAMQHGASISVKYFNDSRYLFKAVPIAVYKEADLVLLRIVRGDIEIPSVVPFTKSSLRSGKPTGGEAIYTLGYPGGVRYERDLVLFKGYVREDARETLENFLETNYVKQLRSHQFPDVALDIYWIKGSLIPGYSGSPCVDKYGRLVGIGDGGLENGAKQVSWLIPAKFLVTLETSPNDPLPQFKPSEIHFCSTVPYAEGEDDNWAESPIYDSIASQDFEFYLVKNRSLKEMYESSGNDYNLIRILNQFRNEFNVSIDPDSLRFDVYEDVKRGVIVAIPEGKRLYYHEKDNHFQVDTAEGQNVNILYNGMPGEFSNKDIRRELDLTFRWLLDSMETYWDVDTFMIEHNFDYINSLYDNPNISDDDNQKVANVLYKSNSSIDKDGSSVTVYLYVTLLMANEKKFMSIASYKISNDRLNSAKAGVNCLDGNNGSPDCEYFQKFITAFCASHLTTFAY